MLRGILEKFFVNKTVTQCKKSRTIQMNAFEIPDNKNTGKLFSKYALLFLGSM